MGSGSVCGPRVLPEAATRAGLTAPSKELASSRPRPRNCVCVAGRPVRPRTLPQPGIGAPCSEPRLLGGLAAQSSTKSPEGQLRAALATAADDRALPVPPPASGLRVHHPARGFFPRSLLFKLIGRRTVPDRGSADSLTSEKTELAAWTQPRSAPGPAARLGLLTPPASRCGRPVSPVLPAPHLRNGVLIVLPQRVTEGLEWPE